MIKKAFVLIIAMGLCPIALADRQLDRTEILDIFTKLTANPQKAWIQTGTIKATHTEYRAPQATDSNEINAHIAEAVRAYQANLNKRELTPELQQFKAEAIPFNVRYRLSNEYTMDSTVTVKASDAPKHKAKGHHLCAIS